MSFPIGRLAVTAPYAEQSKIFSEQYPLIIKKNKKITVKKETDTRTKYCESVPEKTLFSGKHHMPTLVF